jgi:SUR7/PalI family
VPPIPCLIKRTVSNISQLNLTDFTLSTALANSGSSSSITTLAGALENAKQDLDLKDFYTIYLWNYCAWNGDDTYAYCSPRKSEFFFDPIAVWGLNSTGIDSDSILPTNFKNSLNDYKKVSKYMFIVYVIAFIATCLTILVGISALFSRWGSFFTTFLASIAGIFTLAASIIATVLFSVLRGSINDTFKIYNINASLGLHTLRANWIAVVLALAAGFFWLLSVCCCSGRSPYHGRGDTRRVRVEKTPYTYERVGSPYLGPRDSQAVPLRNLGGGDQRNTAYEPFRPQQI